MFRLIIILTTICIVAAVSLAKVYDITKGPIAEQEHIKTINGLKSVLPEFNNDIDKDSKNVVVGSDRHGKDVTMKFYKGKMNNLPVGTAFQYRSTHNDLQFICVTMPPWSGKDESFYVEKSPWIATV